MVQLLVLLECPLDFSAISSRNRAGKGVYLSLSLWLQPPKTLSLCPRLQICLSVAGGTTNLPPQILQKESSWREWGLECSLGTPSYLCPLVYQVVWDHLSVQPSQPQFGVILWVKTTSHSFLYPFTPTEDGWLVKLSWPVSFMERSSSQKCLFPLRNMKKEVNCW